MSVFSARTIVAALLAVVFLVMLLLDRFSLTTNNEFMAQSSNIMMAASSNHPEQELSTSSSTTSSSTHHRILCYGDSLTAGTSPPDAQYYPYAPHLEKSLKHRGLNVTVRHRGLPGWTSEQMLKDLDGPRTGLRSAIQAAGQGLSLVIILAGTNDLGHYQAETIASNVQQLHQISYENGVARTLALSVPPSGYQAHVQEAAAKAQHVNNLLQAFCARDATRATCTASVPFAFERGGANWATDTLHFSPAGYQIMGETLAPVVEQILQTLN